MEPKEQLKILQLSFDRIDPALQKELAASFFIPKADPALITLPPESDPLKADFVFNGERYQLVMLSQDEENIPDDSKIRPISEGRAAVSKAIKGKIPPPVVIGGTFYDAAFHAVHEKAKKYAEQDVDISKLNLIIEVLDFHQEVFTAKDVFQPQVIELKKMIDDAGIVFKEVWLARRIPQADKPVYVDRIKVTNLILPPSAE